MSALEQAQSIYAAFGRGDIPAIMQTISPDVSWEHGALDHGVPWLKPGRGLAHVGSFLQVVGTQLEIKRFDVQQLYAAGDEVIAQIEIEMVVKATGKTIKDLELHHWRFADGKVQAFRHIVDTHQHLLATR